MSKRVITRKPISKKLSLSLALVFAVGFSSVALWLHLTNPGSFASTPYVSKEAESGTVASPAVVQSSSAASGGKYVQFVQPASSGPPHIMFVIMENLSYGDVIGKSSAPYENSLANSYETATQSYGLGHDSLDNYLGLISGNWYANSVNDCDPGGSCSWSDPTLASQLDSAGIPWDAYMEDMPSNCYQSNSGGSGGYGVRHDPFVYFTNLEKNDCNKIQPSTNMLSALNSSSSPDFTWLTPDICDDAGGDAGCATLANGDAYLKKEIAAIQATSWYKNNGIIILTYDEGDGGTVGQELTGNGNHILTIVISAATASKPNYTPYVNHWGVLGSVEKAYGFPCLGQACVANSGSLPL